MPCAKIKNPYNLYAFTTGHGHGPQMNAINTAVRYACTANIGPINKNDADALSVRFSGCLSRPLVVFTFEPITSKLSPIFTKAYNLHTVSIPEPLA
jgi:hypothetical protein